MADVKTRGTKNLPAHEMRIGAIKATVWSNAVPSGAVMFNTVLVRLYRDDQGSWCETHSLGRDDLLTAAKVLDLVHTWVSQAERKQA
ncbi:MAG: hypothetical protein GDA67_15400 [Nitrospira sp. CR1.3]|nr:hypothetical protein [Nitrospira sp. CR1.3]QDV89923.1 hypothetical protein RAS2_09980 [Phycisphaerae bacterium RAS2]